MARKRKRRGRRRVRSVRRPAKVALNGGRVSGKIHPPTSTASPWNNYVLTTTWKAKDVGLQCVSLSDVIGLVITEIGLDSKAPIDLRLVRIDAWTPPAAASSDRNYIVMVPLDWTVRQTDCSKYRAINWYEAWGTAVQPAHIHYIWPRSISNQVLSSTAGDDTRLLLFDVSAVTVSYVLKFHLQWRMNKPDPRPVKSGYLISYRSGDSVPPHDLDNLYVRNQDSDVMDTYVMCGTSSVV